MLNSLTPFKVVVEHSTSVCKAVGSHGSELNSPCDRNSFQSHLFSKYN